MLEFVQHPWTLDGQRLHWEADKFQHCFFINLIAILLHVFVPMSIIDGEISRVLVISLLVFSNSLLKLIVVLCCCPIFDFSLYFELFKANVSIVCIFINEFKFSGIPECIGEPRTNVELLLGILDMLLPKLIPVKFDCPSPWYTGLPKFICWVVKLKFESMI